MVPIGAVPNQTIPVILDGAKRDRRPWSGDLSSRAARVRQPRLRRRTGRTTSRARSRRSAPAQAANGSICGQIGNWTRLPAAPAAFYSTSYSMYYVARPGRRTTCTRATLPFAESQYQTMKNELAYNRALVDPSTGLLVTVGQRARLGLLRRRQARRGDRVQRDLLQGADRRGAARERPRRARPGQRVRRDVAGRRRDVVEPGGRPARQRINATLFDAARGVYKLADRDNGDARGRPRCRRTPTPRRSRSGSRPAGAHAGILRYLKNNLWGTFGPQPYSPDANYSTVISPFVTGHGGRRPLRRRRHRRRAGADPQPVGSDDRPERAVLHRARCGRSSTRTAPTSTANASLAHGWATGPVSSLSGYLLGARPVTAGYKTWIIAPQPGTWQWAQGQIPTPSGALVSRWRRGHGDRSFTLTMAAPAGTSGTVAVPELGRSRTITMDCRVVWRDGAPAAGVTAVERDGAVQFSGVTGSHTFAWGTASLLAELTLRGEGVAVPGLGLLAHRRGAATGHPGDHDVRRPARLASQAREGEYARISGSVPATCFPTASALGSSFDPQLVAAGRRGPRRARPGRRASQVVLGPGSTSSALRCAGATSSTSPRIRWSPACSAPRSSRASRPRASAPRSSTSRRTTRRPTGLRVSADVDERTLREIYLPAFERVVTRRAPWTVMCSYNKVNGTYASQNPWLLTEVLRDEWGFDGAGRLRLGRGPRSGRGARGGAGPGDAAEARRRATRRSWPPCVRASWTRRVLDEAVRSGAAARRARARRAAARRQTVDVDAHHASPGRPPRSARCC